MSSFLLIVIFVIKLIYILYTWIYIHTWEYVFIYIVILLLFINIMITIHFTKITHIIMQYSIIKKISLNHIHYFIPFSIHFVELFHLQFVISCIRTAIFAIDLLFICYCGYVSGTLHHICICANISMCLIPIFS